MSEANSMDCRVGRRVRTVEYDPGWGWIARDPRTGLDVLADFRWASRSAARAVVDDARRLAPPNTN